VVWARLRKQGVKFATVGLSRCSLSTSCLNVGHSLRRKAMPVFVGFHAVWSVGTKNFRRSTQRKPVVNDTCHEQPQCMHASPHPRTAYAAGRRFGRDTVGTTTHVLQLINMASPYITSSHIHTASPLEKWVIK